MIKRLILLFVLALPLTMHSQKFRIPQPNQNVKDAFSLASSIYSGHRNNVSFQNRISEIATLNISVSDPSAMIAEYTKKLEQLEIEAKERAKQKEIELKKKIDLINKGVTQALKAADVDLGVWGNLAKDIVAAGAKNAAINNAKKKIAAAKVQAQQELDKQLKSAMDEVYNKVMGENKTAWDQYMKAAAQAFKQSDEEIYMANMEFHECAMSSMKKNYDYKSTKWLKTVCKTPPNVPSRNTSSTNVGSGISSGSTDYNKALAYGSMSPKEQLAELDKQFNESMQKINKLLENASDPDMKIELMSMKQDLIKKNKEEKKKITSGAKQKSTTKKTITKNYNSKDSYLAAAKRKHHLYNTTMKYPEFLEASKIYLEAEIAENPRNAEAYAFLGSISDDIAKKLAMSAFALYLDKRNPDYKKKFDEDRANFGEKLFASIKNGDIQFIDKAASYNLLKGFTYNEKLPLLYAIELDKKNMIDKLNGGEYTDQQLLMLCIQHGGENTANMYLGQMDLTQPIYLGLYDAFTYSNKYARQKVSSFLLSKSYPVEKPLARIRWKAKTVYSSSIDNILFWSIENDNLDYFKYAAYLKKYVEFIKNDQDISIIEAIIKKGRINLYDVLVAKKYKVVKDKESSSYLELAINNNQEEMCLRLIDDGLDPKIIPSNGGSLVSMVAAKNGHDKLFDRLIKEGVDISCKDSVGKIPMEIAFRAGQEEKAKKLFENNASIDFGYDGGGNQLHWIINNGISSQFVPILAEKVDVNQQNELGDIPILTALKNNKQEHAMTLLKLGSSPDLCNNEKVTPLMYALEKNYPIAAKLAVEVQDPNAIGPGGKSILHYAALVNQIEVCMSMISKGAKVVVFNDQWQTPLRVAKDNKCKVLAKLLKVNMGFSDRMKSTKIWVKVKNMKMFNKKSV